MEWMLTNESWVTSWGSRMKTKAWTGWGFLFLSHLTLFVLYEFMVLEHRVSALENKHKPRMPFCAPREKVRTIDPYGRVIYL